MSFVVLNYQVVEWLDIFADPVFKNPGISKDKITHNVIQAGVQNDWYI